MKKLSYILPILIISSFILSSCCHKKACNGINESVFVVEFEGFSQDEVDTAIIYTYIKNSNFTMLIDSLETYTLDSINTQHYQIWGDEMSTYRDYIVKISSGEEFRISDIETERIKCSQCIPIITKSDYYELMESYKINNKIFYNTYFHIIK